VDHRRSSTTRYSRQIRSRFADPLSSIYVTKGNRPEEALTSSKRELRLLAEAIPTLVWRAGPEGNIQCVNKRVLGPGPKISNPENLPIRTCQRLRQARPL
jgi:hypothetical protein